jgi:hypothetical protein
MGKSNAFIPCIIEFPPLTQDQMISISILDCPAGEDVAFYTGFVKFLFDAFYKPTRNLDEIRYLIKKLFPKYVEPVLQGKLNRDQTTRLLANLKPYMISVSTNMYVRTATCEQMALGKYSCNQIS